MRVAYLLVAAQEETRPVSTLVLDISRVTLIDSAGLGMLLIARDVAVGASWSIVLAGARAQIARMLLLSRFDVLFKLTLWFSASAKQAKVFWFFFSRKNCFLAASPFLVYPQYRLAIIAATKFYRRSARA